MYSCQILWQDGRRTIERQSHNPIEVTEFAKNNVAKNSRAISRIEVHDLSGCLETVWAAAWEKLLDLLIRNGWAPPLCSGGPK